MVIKLYWVSTLLSQRVYYASPYFSFFPSLWIIFLPFINGCQATPEQSGVLDPTDVEAHLRRISDIGYECEEVEVVTASGGNFNQINCREASGERELAGLEDTLGYISRVVCLGVVVTINVYAPFMGYRPPGGLDFCLQ